MVNFIKLCHSKFQQFFSFIQAAGITGYILPKLSHYPNVFVSVKFHMKWILQAMASLLNDTGTVALN